MNGSIFDPTFPIGGKGLELIIKTIKTIFDLFAKPSKEVGETDGDDSINNIERISNAFESFKEQAHAHIGEINKRIVCEVDFYAEELHDLLNESNKCIIDKYKINTKRIDRQISKISNSLSSVIDNEISKRISLDNQECKEIIKMIPGAKKESAIHTFLSKSVKDAVGIGCDELRNSLDEIYEDVDEELLGTFDSIQKQIDTLKNNLSSIQEDNYEESAKKIMTEAYYLCDVCEIVEELL